MGNNESKGLTLTEKIIKNHIICLLYTSDAADE